MNKDNFVSLNMEMFSILFLLTLFKIDSSQDKYEESGNHLPYFTNRFPCNLIDSLWRNHKWYEDNIYGYYWKFMATKPKQTINLPAVSNLLCKIKTV